MSAGHTPGPWLHRGKSDSVHQASKTHPYGATIFRFDEEEVPSDADLSLILSAPDLLAERDRLKTANVSLAKALEAAQQAIDNMKNEAETAAQGDEQMLLDAAEAISNVGLAADMAIRAALANYNENTT